MGFDPFVNYATMNALGMIFLRIFEDAYFKHKTHNSWIEQDIGEIYSATYICFIHLVYYYLQHNSFWYQNCCDEDNFCDMLWPMLGQIMYCKD